MAMESRLLQAGAASPCGFGAAMARRPSALATQKFRVSSQVFFKGAEVRGARDCVATRERGMERFAVSARAGSGSRRPVGKLFAHDSTEGLPWQFLPMSTLLALWN